MCKTNHNCVLAPKLGKSCIMNCMILQEAFNLVLEVWQSSLRCAQPTARIREITEFFIN